MMSQENYVNINDLHAQGWTILEIAEAISSGASG